MSPVGIQFAGVGEGEGDGVCVAVVLQVVDIPYFCYLDIDDDARVFAIVNPPDVTADGLSATRYILPHENPSNADDELLGAYLIIPESPKVEMESIFAKDSDGKSENFNSLHGFSFSSHVPYHTY